MYLAAHLVHSILYFPHFGLDYLQVVAAVAVATVGFVHYLTRRIDRLEFVRLRKDLLQQASAQRATYPAAIDQIYQFLVVALTSASQACQTRNSSVEDWEIMKEWLLQEHRIGPYSAYSQTGFRIETCYLT